MNPAKLTILLTVFLVLSSLLLFAGTTVTAMRGTVKQVVYPGGTETHVWLASDGTTEEVCLGSLHFLKQNGFVPKLGEVIEVTGEQRGHIFVASSVRIGDRMLMLQVRGLYLSGR